MSENSKPNENSMSDVSFDFGKKKKKKKNTPSEKQELKGLEGKMEEMDITTEKPIQESVCLDHMEIDNSVKFADEPPYSYEFLLNRICQSKPEDEKKEKIPPPQVFKEGTKRIVLANFADYCRCFARSAPHIADFFSSELSCESTIDGMGRLKLLIRKLKAEDIRTLLVKYIKNYVRCPSCNCPDTILTKINRINTIICNKCKAQRTVEEFKRQ